MEPPSPQCVGREFVRQYYTLLNQAPLHLHRFYSHNSSFVHGGLDNGRDAEAVFGQHEIHQKIMTLNFRDCHAKIRQVDSHETLANGVVVQVSGELSNNGEPMRRFMQTFVLAPQSPKKYYVHNDIFRYQDEVFDDPDTSTGGASTTEEQIREMKEQQRDALVQEVGKVQPPVVEVNKEAPSVGLQQHTNGSSVYEPDNSPAAVIEPMTVEEPIAEWKEPVVASPPPPAATFQQEQQWKSPEPETVETEEEEVVDVSCDPAPGDQEAAAASEPGPRTWSSLVKSGAGAPGKPPVAPQTSLGGGAPREAKEGTPFSTGAGPTGGKQGGQGQGGQSGGYQRGQRGSSQGRSPGQGQTGQRSERYSKEETDMTKNGDSNQLFVGNLPHNCTEDDLADLFSKHGKVVDVRINQKQGRESAVRGRDGKPNIVPNFGFIVFADAESVERVLKEKPIYLNNNHRLNVEEKKRQGPGSFSDRDRQDMGKRGSQDNLRGAGHPGGGRGGGDRGRGGGRGGPRGRGDFNRGGRGGGPDRGGYRGRGGII